MAIDAGSNAIRLHLVLPSSTGKLRRLSKKRFAVRMGRSAFRSGAFSEKAMTKALRAFEEIRELMDESGVVEYRAVATSAWREARNGEDLVRRIERTTGIRLQVISGLEEAHLIRSAVFDHLDPLNPSLIVDLGGGSLEINLVEGGCLRRSMSVPIGTVRLIERFRASGRMSVKKSEELATEVDRALETFLPRGQVTISSQGVPTACGGNLEVLARLAPTDGMSLFDEISLNRLEEILPDLLSRDASSLQKKFGLRKDRAEVIGVAALIVSRLGRHLGLSTLCVPGVGLRQGLLLELSRRRSQPSAVERRSLDAPVAVS